MKKHILGILIVVMLCLTGCNSEPMTEEERAAYEASRTHEYQVVSVYQYIATQTNNFGAVINQELKYCFTYIGDDGQLHQFNGFEHTEYGLWKVCIGSENKYIDGIGGYGYWRGGEIPRFVEPKGWSIDCLPCGYLRLFSRSSLTAGPALSNFEIYAK